jgi:hypothetical protein
MSETPPPPRRPKPDIAARSGEIAGKIVGGLGARLLRTRPVREAVRRGYEEATRDDEDTGAPDSSPPRG